MAKQQQAAWDAYITELEAKVKAQDVAFAKLTPDERMSQARKAFNKYSDDRYRLESSMSDKQFPTQQRLLEIKNQYPQEYPQLVQENVDDNLLLQEKLAFNMDPWNQDPITHAGLQDAAFKSFSPIGTHNTKIRGHIGGYQNPSNDRMGFTGYALHDKFKHPAEGVISHEARHRILPTTPGAERSYADASKQDEEYRNRQIDELYRRKNPYYAPAKYIPEVNQQDMDYFNKVISDQNLPQSDFFTTENNPEMSFWDNIKTLF